MSKEVEILPKNNESPASFADRVGVTYSTLVKQSQKKNNGQFFTPTSIAQFMGSLVNLQKDEIDVLDPGCGTAILSCALLETLATTNSKLKHIRLDLYEIDKEVLPYTLAVLEYLKTWLLPKGISLNYSLFDVDFVIKNSQVFNQNNLLFSNTFHQQYDFIISNPPYFKLNKEDIRSKIAESILSGQSNIYAIFMAVASKLLKENGQMIFITPRSYASGSYFKSFREFLFSNIIINHIHLFDSRKETFNRDNVLQETIIIKATKGNSNLTNSNIQVSSSKSVLDLNNPRIKIYNQSQILNLKCKEKILHVPINDEEEYIVELFKSWNGSLNNYNIQISTGPVVAFRANDHIKEVYENGTVFLAPLIWLHNVSKMNIDWPMVKPNKGQYIKICEESMSLLIPNKNYILLRRFSAKDDKSRLIASPYLANSNKSEYLGVENKVNYIYRPKGELELAEVYGLAALLNSKLFDNYFRIFNGNVNVSATELRLMPLPPLDKIKKIGEEVILNKEITQDEIDKLVNGIIMNQNELVL